TLLAYAPMVRTCLDAAEAAAEEGRSLAVVDLRSLSPLDLEPAYELVRRTGRVNAVHEAPTTVGLAAEIAARVMEECFYYLEAPPLRVAGCDMPDPVARAEEDYLPDLDRVPDAVARVLAHGGGAAWRRRTTAGCRPSERVWPRPGPWRGGRRRGTRWRSTACWSRWRPPRAWWSCPPRGPGRSRSCSSPKGRSCRSGHRSSGWRSSRRRPTAR